MLLGSGEQLWYVCVCVVAHIEKHICIFILHVELVSDLVHYTTDGYDLLRLCARQSGTKHADLTVLHL